LEIGLGYPNFIKFTGFGFNVVFFSKITTS